MASTISAGTSAGTAIAITGDTTGALALQTNNGTTAVTIDTSQNATVVGNVTSSALIPSGSTVPTNGIFLPTTNTVGFSTGTSERMRITSAGNALFNKTSTGSNLVGFEMENGGAFLAVRDDGPAVIVNRLTATGSLVLFRYNSSGVGDISTNGSTTSYNITSDRRLKENIVPFTTGLSTVLQLKPSEYNYIKDPSTQMQGFIADELQAVVPNAVTGETNAVDEEGKPVYQGVDVSFLIPHLVSAIQELNAKVDAQVAEIQAFKGVA